MKWVHSISIYWKRWTEKRVLKEKNDRLCGTRASGLPFSFFSRDAVLFSFSFLLLVELLADHRLTVCEQETVQYAQRGWTVDDATASMTHSYKWREPIECFCLSIFVRIVDVTLFLFVIRPLPSFYFVSFRSLDIWIVFFLAKRLCRPVRRYFRKRWTFGGAFFLALLALSSL